MGSSAQVLPQIVDLFCGCGGLALGAKAAGFGPELAFDVDPILTSSFSRNFPKATLKLANLAEVTGKQIREHTAKEVLGVFGGPPCQAFSSIGRRKVDDPRRELLTHFFRLVSEIKPAFFVMENVSGLGYVDAKPFLDDALGLVAARYTLVGPTILDAADFGAATRRRRLFVVGFDPARCDPLKLGDFKTRETAAATVKDAIGDLHRAKLVEDDAGYDVWQLPVDSDQCEYRKPLLAKNRRFTGHRETEHTAEVIARFKELGQGEVDPVGRHPRLRWAGQCPTLRAGTGSDLGSYQSVRPIHPTRARVITVREGARLQGFPDSFRFHPTVWHSFRMIGNSVSPVMATAIFSLLAARTISAPVEA